MAPHPRRDDPKDLKATPMAKFFPFLPAEEEGVLECEPKKTKRKKKKKK